MVEINGVYLIDKLENIGNCAGIGANFAAACEFVAKGDFASLKPGRNEIDGDSVFVNCDEARYVAPEDRRVEFLALLDESAQQTFDDAKDCGFAEQRVEWFTVRRGEFAVCWPRTCAHAPAVTTDAPKSARKLIVKIKA